MSNFASCCDAVRVRLGSVVEWAIAALFLVASVGVASLAMRELRATAAVAAPVPIFAAAPPAGLGDRAVSVQHLLPSTFPTGVVTGLVGAPYLLWLLATANKEGRAE